MYRNYLSQTNFLFLESSKRICGVSSILQKNLIQKVKIIE